VYFSKRPSVKQNLRYHYGARQSQRRRGSHVSSWQYYAGGGFIGLWFVNAAGALLDDFGGGNVTSAPATTPAYKLLNYTFTGQYSYMDDPSTAAVTEGFGLMFYVSRMYDPALGRFAQADSIIPQGVQGLDRFGYANNNPVRYTDPTGHSIDCAVGEQNCSAGKLVPNWWRNFKEHIILMVMDISTQGISKGDEIQRNTCLRSLKHSERTAD
jgi:RHS repeat-associated protein